jgi:hypothetical protein
MRGDGDGNDTEDDDDEWVSCEWKESWTQTVKLAGEEDLEEE